MTLANKHIAWLLANGDELAALRKAEDGDPSALTDYIESGRKLNTHTAREFVAKRLRGESMGGRGRRRTHTQKHLELSYLIALNEIRRELGCSEYRAREVYLDRNPKSNMSQDTLKTYVRRAKQTLKEKEPVPLEVQKWANSEPSHED